jgi:hypothetical protein
LQISFVLLALVLAFANHLLGYLERITPLGLKEDSSTSLNAALKRFQLLPRPRAMLTRLYNTAVEGTASAMDSTSAPLADYFWIAGIDSLSLGDPKSASSSNTRDKTPNGVPVSPPIETTIEEGSEIELTDPILGSAPRPRARHSRNNSWQRLSRLSNDARNSIHSVELIGNSNSNRSSATIRAGPPASTNSTKNVEGLAEFDFDRALSKFANERESFLEDLGFSAGTVLQSRPPMTNRAERLKHDESETNGRKSPFGKVGGSIRRKISFRDMNSMKRQTTISRASESRIYISLSKFGKLQTERVQIGVVSVIGCPKALTSTHGQNSNGNFFKL